MAIHILWGGFALCGFSPHVPAKWPAGHTWVGATDPDISAATCEACLVCVDSKKPLPEHSEFAEHAKSCAQCTDAFAAKVHGELATAAGHLTRQLGADFVCVVALQQSRDGNIANGMSAFAQTDRGKSAPMQSSAARMLRELAAELEAQAETWELSERKRATAKP